VLPTRKREKKILGRRMRRCERLAAGVIMKKRTVDGGGSDKTVPSIRLTRRPVRSKGYRLCERQKKVS